MTTTRQFLLIDETGTARLPVLLAACAYIPASGRPYTIEQMEVFAALKTELWRVTIEVEGGRKYRGGEQTLSLTPGQIELLRQRLVEYPHWNPLMLDVVAETYRWLGLGETPPA